MNNISAKLRLTIIYLVLGILTVFVYSCKDNAVTTYGTPQMSVSLKADETALDDAVITLDSAKGLLESVKLEGSSEANIKDGPFVVHVNLNGTLNTVAVANIGGGTYDHITFKFHKYNPNEVVLDPDFGSGNQPGYSFVIAGRYNDSPFVYKSPRTAIQQVVVEPKSVVSPAVSIVYNVTLVVNPKDWFMKNGVLMDPRDPANQNDIDNNIQASFKKAFKDDNKDGLPDN